MARQLLALLDSLVEDGLRKGAPFSADILDANRVLNYPYSEEYERIAAMECWLQGNQPCIFGRAAAKQHGIDFCFITDEDIYKSDEHVHEKIQKSRMLWKRRAYRGEPKHGFMLAVCSNRVLNARPDAKLKEFCLLIQSLAGWPTRPDPASNYLADEWLYLKHNATGGARKFVFTVDFFAAAGHERWWHDHRIPGGVAFTANSLGHMVALKEPKRGDGSPIEWALRVAMLTISTAHETRHGPATWLLDQKGEPIRPFNWTEDAPIPELSKFPNKDHGSYAGYLHTDHAIREEFFDERDVPSTKTAPYLMDFKYIFDKSAPDRSPFIEGLPVAIDEVQREIGDEDSWRTIAAADGDSRPTRPKFADDEVAAALRACRAWEMSDSALARLMENV